MITTDYQLTKNGFDLSFGSRKRFKIIYPKRIFSSLPAETKKNLAQNFLYCRSAVLGIKPKQSFTYPGPKPALKNLVDYGIIGDLPRIAIELGTKTAKLKANFRFFQQKNLKFLRPKKEKENLLPSRPTKKNQAILALSFGKDSLLSYGLAKEIGLNLKIVFVREMEGPYAQEIRLKDAIIKEFINEQKEKINLLQDNIDEFLLQKQFGRNTEELANANGMLAFTLELLPFAYFYSARYLIFGNEKNFDNHFINNEGLKGYPSFDQTSFYSQKENQQLKKITDNNLQVTSLIEPLYNLAEIKILSNRYPHLLKYMMSCDDNLKDDKWCYQCPMCAKAFIYMAAVGSNPEKIGFKKDFLDKKYANLYPIFGKITRPYERPPQVRQEELLAFLLAQRHGFKGELMEIFRKKYLKETLRHEKQWRKRFFGVHQTKNLPAEFKSKIIKIYREELKSLT